jgi:DMSO/TMAO reductase YedYZ molybdopterin-dependent catalytic subunit
MNPYSRRTFLTAIVATALAITLPVIARAAAPASFQISGDVAKPRTWTAEQLASQFATEVKTVEYTSKSGKTRSRCVPLISVLNAAQPNVNPNVKHHLLAFAVLARGGDGYTVAFSMGELMPEIGKREVWIALDRDGQPFADEEGPVALVVPGDGKAGRWVHGVARIQVIDEIGARNSSPATP